MKPGWRACGMVLGLVLIAGLARAQVTQARQLVPSAPGASYIPPPAPPLSRCVGPDCPHEPSVAERAFLQPMTMPVIAGSRVVSRRERFARTSAVLGAVSAGLVLGGAIGIAAVDDLRSERVTRGVWLGYTATTAPLVALSVWLAGRQSGFTGYKPLRSLGWLSYTLAVTNGAFMWSSAFQHQETSKVLTVSAGIFGALAILPHALEAVSAARSLRIKRVRARLGLSANGNGLLLTF